MEPAHKCEHCGASLKMYWHSLTPGLVSVLVKCIRFVRDNQRNRFHLQKDLHLTVNEFSNFTKLRFHGLVAHADESMDERSGYWLITKRGGQFLRGEISVPRKVLTFRNAVKDHSPDVIWISSLKDHIPYYEREFAYEYAQPPASNPANINQPTLV